MATKREPRCRNILHRWARRRENGRCRGEEAGQDFPESLNHVHTASQIPKTPKQLFPVGIEAFTAARQGHDRPRRIRASNFRLPQCKALSVGLEKDRNQCEKCPFTMQVRQFPSRSVPREAASCSQTRVLFLNFSSALASPAAGFRFLRRYNAAAPATDFDAGGVVEFDVHAAHHIAQH